MDDTTLRGFSNYPPEALKPWKQHNPKWKIPWTPLIIDIVFLAVSVVFTAKSFGRRLSWTKVRAFLRISKAEQSPSLHSITATESDAEPEKKGADVQSTTGSSSEGDSPRLPREPSYVSFVPPPTYSGVHTPAPEYQTPFTSQRPSRDNSMVDLAIPPLPRTESAGNLYMKTKSYPTLPRAAIMAATYSKDGFQISRSSSSGSLARIDATPTDFDAITPIPATFVSSPTSAPASGLPILVEPTFATKSADDQPQSTADGKKPEATVKVEAVGETNTTTQPPKQQRVDYLAGFIAMSAILVTMNHFGLTFWAGVIIPSVRPHYKSETWARKTIATYFLDPLWIGPFLMISTRFLTSNYLRTGKLDNMAQKIVARPFRLLVPVASIATLEYFLMDAGALHWLEYLASVTWSPWPFTTIVQNPGIFISEIIQLAYLIPNAAPMITYNYCTGVLWTIPVQLQGAWQTLLALIMVRECKTPVKRFLFYAFCISQHWYGLSWGSYYYAGVLLADLDITFKYKSWLHPRPWAYYPVLWFLIVTALGGFTLDMITQWTGVNYAEVEYGWYIFPSPILLVCWAAEDSFISSALSLYKKHGANHLQASGHRDRPHHLPSRKIRVSGLLYSSTKRSYNYC